MATTRAAPLKTQTIPRLELCAAVLLSKLLASIMSDLKIHIQNIVAWSDSDIVLGWLRSSPKLLLQIELQRL